MPKTKKLAQQLLNWYASEGRDHLPWRKRISAYRVWISEIMLQQTQVSTVLPYFKQFMQRFATLKKLADSPLDDVLHAWSGLGYYTRARNIHRSAQIIQEKYQGRFPDNFDAILALPGIGRSTAGAILSIAFKKPYPILDGNVKRILMRLNAIQEPFSSKIEKQLWQASTDLLPDTQVDDYTQAIMDLGATICTRGKPKCEQCPWQSSCKAYQLNLSSEIPVANKQKVLPLRQKTMWLLQRADGAIYLERRPMKGVWAQQWCFPETDTAQDQALTTVLANSKCKLKKLAKLARIEHTFSHYRLEIQPILVKVQHRTNCVMENDNQLWYKSEAMQLPLAAPVKRLWSQISHDT